MTIDQLQNRSSAIGRAAFSYAAATRFRSLGIAPRCFCGEKSARFTGAVPAKGARFWKNVTPKNTDNSAFVAETVEAEKNGRICHYILSAKNITKICENL
ncbi:MAG: hypothetical protein IJM18_07315, partial [Clostridia bacterium]|nr:hypothetical protein [Clostridia bacterium]